MKKISKVIIIFVFLLMLVSCDKNTSNKDQASKDLIVTFNPNGGEYNGEEKQNVKEGKQISIPNDPTRVGYTFDGWYLGDEKWSFASNVVTIDLTLTAHWKINQYSITLKFNDGVTEDKVITQDYNSVVTVNEPTRTGYTFDKWSEAIPKTMPAENKTIEASWIINQYTLTIKYNDGVTQDKVITQDYNSVVTIHNPTRTGYSFNGWTETIPETMPAENKTINAIWVCDVKYSMYNNTLTITGMNTYVSKLTILSSYEGYSVTSIGKNAFRNCTNLASVTIPDSVTSIGDYTFSDCTYLKNITIPDKVISIGDYAFNYCTYLKSITIPNSVISIGDYAFYNCIGLTSIIVDANNKKYDSRDNCNAIIETSTNTLMFGCMNTIIPNTITSIESFAFYKCTGLTSITIPNSVINIGMSAFSGCTGLTSIIIPSSVISIGKSSFSKCEFLKNIVIEDGLTSIGQFAFFNCTSLKSIIIPDSVTSIGQYAFEDCDDLTIYCEALSKPTDWDLKWNSSTKSVVWGYKEN